MKLLFVNTDPLTEHGIGQALAELGHEVHYVFLAGESSLDPFLSSIRPDYVFTEGGYGLFDKLFTALRKVNIPHIYWATEDPIDFYHLSLPFAARSDIVFTTSLESIPIYRKHSIKAHLFMFACLPSYHHRVNPESCFEHDLVFAGNQYPHLARMKGEQTILRPLLDGGYDIKIYGSEAWVDQNNYLKIMPSQYGGYLPNNYLPVLCSSAKIVLGLHSVDDSLTMMSMRTFEVLGCGGFYLTQWTPAIEYHFKNHYHLVWSKSAAETRELVDYYLAHPEEREKIALQGQQEVYAHHTYHHRAEDLIKVVERSNKVKYFGTEDVTIKITPSRRIAIKVKK